MNKKLIALAVAGACVAPTVMAQTANPVTLYGRVYATFESVEAKGTPNVVRRNRVADQASYLGVRGTEDLGGGLKAVFQLETGFPPDNTTGTFASRNSMVGLQGGFGTVIFGRWDSPMKITQTAVDPWGDLTNGDITGAALRQGDFSQRWNNNVQYWSPTFAGFNARLMYVANESKTAATNPEAYGASLAYSAGPFYAAYAYEKHKNFTAQTVTANVSEEGNAVAASYQLGPFKLSGEYGEYKRTNTSKQKSYMVGGEWALGKHVILGSFQNSKDGGANLSTSPAQPECDMYSIGYRYDFSKRTFFIASYTKVDNNSTSALCNFGTNALTIAAGQDPQGVGLGVRHLF
jgi:predicted porin